MRGLRLIVWLIVVTVLVLPAIYVAGLLGTTGDKPARDILFLIFYVAIALTLSANAAIAFTLSLTAALAAPGQPVGNAFAQRVRRVARQETVPPQMLIGLMLAPMMVLMLGFGAWAFTALYRAGNPLFLALTALDLAALSAALLALMLLVSILMVHRARRAAESEDPSAR